MDCTYNILDIMGKADNPNYRPAQQQQGAKRKTIADLPDARLLYNESVQSEAELDAIELDRVVTAIMSAPKKQLSVEFNNLRDNTIAALKSLNYKVDYERTGYADYAYVVSWNYADQTTDEKA